MKNQRAIAMSVGLFVIGWTVTQAAPDEPRKFGPEWKKDGDSYSRKLEIAVTHSAGGNVSAYSIPLERGEVGIVESDNDRGVEVRMHPHGSLGIVKDQKGKVRELSVQLRDNIYFDLDADGMIDAFYDNRGGRQKAMIIVEGRFVEVEDNKAVFRAAPNEKLQVWGVGRNVRYVFQRGSWSIERQP